MDQGIAGSKDPDMGQAPNLARNAAMRVRMYITSKARTNLEAFILNPIPCRTLSI